MDEFIGIQSQPLKSHKVCSLHFPGAKKSFGSLTTVIKKSCRQTVNCSQGREHNKDNETTTETTQSEQQTSSIDAQESANDKLYNKI